MSSALRETSPGRLLLLGGLLALGLCYLASFAWLVRNSSDFVARDLDRSAQSKAQSSTLAVIDAFTFADGSPGTALLGTGWMLPDAEGSWTESDGGTFFLPANFGGRRVELDFAVHFVGGDEPLCITLSANDDHVADWQPTASAHEVHARVQIPPAAVADRSLRMQFRIKRPQPSLWPGTPPGARAYGLKLRHVRVLAGEP